MAARKPSHILNIKRTRSIFRGERWTFDIVAVANGQTVVPPERYHNVGDVESMAVALRDGKIEIVVDE